MALLTKKIRCSTCGNRNEPTQSKCAVCTRPIHEQPLASQVLHDEHLWSAPVESRRTRKENGLGKWAVLCMALVALAISNYYYFGYGPDWASTVPDHEKAYDWRTYTGTNYRADLPGNPVVADKASAAGTFEVSSVWVNSRWNLIRDADTQTAGAERAALQSLYGTLVTAQGASVGPIEDVAPAILRTLLNDVTVDETIVSKVESPPFGMGYDVTATFRGHPTEASSGIVKARIWTVGKTTYVAATFYDDAVEEGLHSKLVQSFTPSL